ncbi:hypothetical protein Tco_1406883 [Tanacetum coccineum]
MTKNENFLDFKACTPIILKILIKFTTRPLLTNYGTKEVKAQEKIEVATIAAKKVTSLVSVQSPKKIRLLSDKLGAIAKTATNDIIDLQKENEEILKFSKDFSKTYEKLLQEKCALEKEHSKLFSKVNQLELEVKKLAKSKEVVEPCKKFDVLTQEVDSLKCNVPRLQDEALNFSKFKKSSVVLDDMLSRQKLSRDKKGLGFSNNEKTNSLSLNKPITFIKERQNGTPKRSTSDAPSDAPVRHQRASRVIKNRILFSDFVKPVGPKTHFANTLGT